MIIEQWIATIIIGLVIVPSIVWLVKEVLTLRKDLLRLETQQAERWQNWSRILNELYKSFDQLSQDGKSKSDLLTKLDRNVVRLCQKAGTEYEQ